MKHPFHQFHLYEIGSRLFCGKKGKPIHELWIELQKNTLFNWADEIWLMGVWKNSPSSQNIARSMPELQIEYQKVKSSANPDDVYGSPYSIYDYVPDPLVSHSFDLTEIYTWFQSKNKKLILDFVPNHMAIDSPIISKFPNLFLKAKGNEEAKNTFLHSNGIRYVHGKDPYYDGWTDTIQWDFSNPEVETFHIHLLKNIAKQCDGVRCDMAMLPLPEVFDKTHGIKSVYDWKKIIHAVKEEYPNFKFYAEVYWGLEDSLQSLGFDATYDKFFYDSLKHKNLNQVFELMQYQTHSSHIRFLENHDEDRANHTFGEQTNTYFGLLCANPGIILVFDGQELGFHKKIPVQMIGTFEETPDPKVSTFFNRALSVMNNREKRIEYGEINYSEFNFLPIFARVLHSKNQTELFIWNFQQVMISGWIPFQEGISFQKELRDIVSGESYSQEKNEKGLYYKLNPNQLQWFIF
ncbi:conserved hypothetical protein [Leptospira biflexa serovar Patoc strain 'Patoc 1 (Ames)']|uniref:Putative alpha amylase n=1 Tax=Leptospira biflexa serovar Patoc (strain Patoc 1 / ATCC 23582 / Paris) TaxID=456481 RepID=B0STH8_LEPBP|nr:alpha-amylase family glycosyl hydrolase [Leptospira biflexa]ABZ94750.1 conserved hypothetical protein [Leptospira biflexa serovar Patoc strain 'Patoc 1 (Ames)']ABZ98418.1 Putative alpha amylase [Leptospira biflexa serovar Patoc strain 'Patoc 1 (Paris)']